MTGWAVYLYPCITALSFSPRLFFCCGGWLLLLLLSRFSHVWLCGTPWRQPTRLSHPWDPPGKNTGVGCHFFSNAWKWKVKVKSLSCVRLLVTPWNAAHQAPPSMGFSKQEYWSGVPLPSQGGGSGGRTTNGNSSYFEHLLKSPAKYLHQRGLWEHQEEAQCGGNNPLEPGAWDQSFSGPEGRPGRRLWGQRRHQATEDPAYSCHVLGAP